MAQRIIETCSMMSVNEFREILEDALDHHQRLPRTDIEAFAYYLLSALEEAGVVNDVFGRSDYLYTIREFLQEWFPKHTRLPYA